MTREIDRNRRATRIAGVVIAGLFLQALVANLLWMPPSPTSGSQPRMPPSENPFPVLHMGPLLHNVTIDAEANLSTRVLLTSLQGLVNRVQVELYLDVEELRGKTSMTLSFLMSRYNVTSVPMSMEEAIDAYANRAAGLVVFDPTRPESINIGTMIASQQNGILVGPDLADWMTARTGLQPLFEYARSDWTSMNAIAAYDRALRDLYPSSASTLLAILPPDRWAIRDYLIATGTFVFYLPQGILATPSETAATKRILHATPRGIPILGWFNSPTLTEENSFVQLASGEGKFVVGGQDVPNLSVLTALGRNESRRQPALPPGPTSLEDKTYVVLAVPDGDNLDFAAGRMWEIWSEPVRGTVPIAWSLNPLLSELAPPLLDAYYDAATPLDRFIAAPSGAGYLYPDYTAGGDLASYVEFSKRYMDAADMDVVWLLNAFTAFEIPYSGASLSTYVDGLRPDGIVLDYADQPRTRDAWVEAGAQAVAPIVRSTHFWTTRENVLGKVDAARVTGKAGPHFLWLTVYTFRFDLRDALSLVDDLASRSTQVVEVVTPNRFFALLRASFLETVRHRLRDAETDPIQTLLFGATLESARSRLREADAFLAAGDADRAAYAAFRGLESLRDVASGEAVLFGLGVVFAMGLLAHIGRQRSRLGSNRRDAFRPGVFLIVTTVVAFLVFAIREALLQNFWTYPTILIGIAAAGVHRPLRRIIDRAYPDRAPLGAAIAALVLSSLAIRTTAAFPLALVACLLALETALSRRPASAEEVLAGLAFGTAIGVVGGFELVTFTVLALLLVGSTSLVRGLPLPEARAPRPRALLPGFLLALPLSALAVASYYSLAVRLDVQGERLGDLAGALLVLGPTLGILGRRLSWKVPSRSAAIGALALAAVFGGVMPVVDGAVWAALALLALFAALAYAAVAALEEFAHAGGEPRRALAVAILFLPLLMIFFRLPPIIYSLAFVPLPEAVEYALYAPTVMLAATGLVLAVIVILRGRGRASVGKHYARGEDGGAGGP